jgi:hypothetical protein
VVVAPSRRPDPDVTHSPPSPPSTHRVMLEAAYSHPPRLLSQSIALRSRPAGLPTTRLSPPEHTRRTDRAASAPHNSENYRVDTDKRNAMPRTRARASRSRCGGSGWRSSPGVTAQRTPPESRWRRCGRGSSMSDAWAINGPLRTANGALRTANAGPPASAISAPGCLMPACRRNDPELPSWSCRH